MIDLTKFNPEDESVFYIDGTPVFFRVEEDREEDCIKLDHFFINAYTGEYHSSMNWTPYGVPSSLEVERYIKLGRPRGLLGVSSKSPYPTHFNFDHDSLEAVWSGQTKGWKGWDAIVPVNRI